MSFQGMFGHNVPDEQPQIQEGYLDYIQQQNIGKRHALEAERRRRTERTKGQKIRDRFRRMFGGQQPVPIPADPNVRLPPAYGHYVDPNDPNTVYERHGPVGWEQHFPEWDNVGQDYEKPFMNDEHKKYFERKGYFFKNVLGEGGFGEVWRVKRKVPGLRHKEELACKIMSIKSQEIRGYSVRDAVSKLLSESEVMRELNYPHIVRQTDVMLVSDEITGFPYSFIFQFMELCNGSLVDMHLDLPGMKMDEMEAKEWFSDVAKGLCYLHNHNVSHLDIKPDNILYKLETMGVNNQSIMWKLTDFGLSMKFDALAPNVHNVAQGTIIFVAPEVLSGRQYETKPSDVFSLGMTLIVSLIDMNREPLPYLKNIRKGGSWSNQFHLSREALDLIKNMCREDPADRWTIHQVLASQWVTT